MKRLLDEAPDAESQELARLVAQMPPLEINPMTQRRIWVGLNRRRRGAPRPRAFTLLAVAGLFVSGTVFATLGGRWWGAPASPESEGTEESPREAVPAQRPEGATARAPAQAAEESPDLDAEADPEAPAPSEAEGARAAFSAPATSPKIATRAAPAPGAGSSSKSAERSSAASPALASGEDPTPVLEAIRAWRTDRNAPKARSLLSGYLVKNPRGALAEDALALLIEVSAAQKDPRAADYAKRYLRGYPRGRFRAMAERVAGTSP